MNDINNKNTIKRRDIVLRQSKVAKLHIRGVSIKEMALQFNVDERTINRDIQEIRQKRLQMFNSNKEAKEWVRNELADTIGYLDETKKIFLQQSFDFKGENTKSRALWYSVQTTSIKAEILKSLMQLVFDINIASSELHNDYEED
jgi:transposase